MARTNKNSRAYWRDREINHAKNVLKDDKKIVSKIASLYRNTAKEIEKEVNTMLSSYAAKESLSLADVKKKVNKTDIRDYESKAKRYVKEKNFSKRANDEMAIYNLKMKLSRFELMMHYIDLELVAMADETDKLVYERLLDV